MNEKDLELEELSLEEIMKEFGGEVDADLLEDTQDLMEAISAMEDEESSEEQPEELNSEILYALTEEMPEEDFAEERYRQGLPCIRTVLPASDCRRGTDDHEGTGFAQPQPAGSVVLVEKQGEVYALPAGHNGGEEARKGKETLSAFFPA